MRTTEHHGKENLPIYASKNFGFNKIVCTYLQVRTSAPSCLIADVKCLTYYLLSPRHTNCVELDIGHPCYDILTAVRIGYLLTGVT